MTRGISERFLAFSRFLFFNILSVKFNSATFKNFMDYAYVIFEKIACSFEIMSSKYLKLYDELIEKEINMANITKNSKILVIGCGSLPVTSILIGSKTHSDIVSIDFDKKAVLKAKKFVNNHDLSLKLKIEYGGGLTYPIENFDVIFVLYGVKRQLEILSNLSEKIKSDVLIVFRTTQDVLDQEFNGTKLLSEMFDIKDSSSSDAIYTSYSYLLGKKR